MNGRSLVALVIVAGLAFAAGFGVARISDSTDSKPGGATHPASPTGPTNQTVTGGTTEPAEPELDKTFTLTAHVTGPLPRAGDPCYADTLTLSVEDASSGLSHPILAYPDTEEAATCEQVLVTFSVPRADAYLISFQDASRSGSWGPYSFSFLERSGWDIYVQTF